MKFFTFLTALLFASIITNAQENPCPTVTGTRRVVLTNAPACSELIRFNATGDISSDKSVNITVYEGTGTSGNPVLNQCFVIGKSSPRTEYNSLPYTRDCNQTFTIVVTRYTASNGLCQGGACGTAILGPDGAPLPIKLAAFTGERRGNSVELKWKADSEIGALEYQVERNTGNGFSRRSTVPTKNSLTASNYAIDDINTSAKISEYRLKMVDIDGKFKYSNVVAIKGTGAASDFTVYPNPISKGSTTIVKITDITDATTLSVIDYTGRLVKQLPTNSSTINISNLPPGSYLIRITNSKTGGNTTQKLAVAN